MPIIEPVPDQSAPLSQGDILKGVSLFSTKKSWTEGGGEPERINRTLSLVLSRPCVASHDEWVFVAAVEKYKNKPPAEFESFDEAKQFFLEIRDGLTTPDQFYLGQIPGYEGSFCGRLDSCQGVLLFGKVEKNQGFWVKKFLQLASPAPISYYIALMVCFTL